MEHEELQVLTEFRPRVGGEYESKDARGNWWDITITAENPNGTFCADVHDGHNTVWDKVHASNVIEKPPREDEPTTLWRTLVVVLVDAVACTFLGLWFYHGLWIPSTANEIFWWTLVGVSVLWRCRLMKKRDLPFCCVRMETSPRHFGNDVDVYMCGTMHVSPGSVTDTKEVISKLQPDIIMIELDRDRLHDMKEDLANAGAAERYELELQVNERAIRGVHADWNSSCEHGQFGSYPVMVEEDNPYGEKRDTSLSEHVYVCRRGKQSMYAQTIWAQNRGARGVVIIDDESQPEVGLISAGGLCRSLANCICYTRTVAIPSIPTFLVKDEISDGAYLEAFLKSNEVPRPIPFRNKLCRAVVLTVSGIGILYEVIRKAGVKVGHEFLTADAEAAKLGHPCVCIDISVGNLGSKLKKELFPSPTNLMSTIQLILAFPRSFFTRVLFPIKDLDLMACMVWAFARFKVRTWLAFIVATTLACMIVAIIVWLPGFFISQASSHISPNNSWGTTFETFLPFVIELYIFPAIYRGLLDQRDEEMYRAIASQVRRRPEKKTFVAVVGAAHVNGIIARGRRRGL